MYTVLTACRLRASSTMGIIAITLSGTTAPVVHVVQPLYKSGEKQCEKTDKKITVYFIREKISSLQAHKSFIRKKNYHALQYSIIVFIMGSTPYLLNIFITAWEK